MCESEEFDGTRESLKCANQPQRANGSTYGFKCCHYHVTKLIEKGLKVYQVDEYIDWKWCQEKIKAIKLKISKLQKKKNKNKDQDEEDKLYDQIERINKFISNQYNEEDINNFESVSACNDELRRSKRQKSDKERADLAECMLQENENELLNILEEWFDEQNLSPYQLQYSNRMCHIKFMSNLL